MVSAKYVDQSSKVENHNPKILIQILREFQSGLNNFNLIQFQSFLTPISDIFPASLLLYSLYIQTSATPQSASLASSLLEAKRLSPMHLNAAKESVTRRRLGHGDSGPPALGPVAPDLTASTRKNSTHCFGAAPYRDTVHARPKSNVCSIYTLQVCMCV